MPLPAAASRSGALSGAITVPGDKSISHRSLLFGLLADGETTVSGLLESEDILATAGAVTSLGGHVEHLEDGTWHVTGAGLGCLRSPEEPIDFGNAGTGVRLTFGVVAGHAITATFDGDASLRKRPMGRVLLPLGTMGAVTSPDGADKLPLSLTGTGAPIPIEYTLPVASAQVKSAILLAGLTSPGEVTIIEPEATRDHTENMLRAFGAKLKTEAKADGGAVITLTGRERLSGQQVTVPGDPSSSSFAAVAATLVEGSEITIKNILLNPTRTGYLTTLQEMGADIAIINERETGGEAVGDVVVKHASLKGVEIPPDRAPSMIDEYPVIAVAAAMAEGTTKMTGLAELRVKESDRLAAVADGLRANGVSFEEGEDWLIVHGTGGDITGGGTVATHLDHRIAMSFLVMGLVAKSPVRVDDTAMIATSYPTFVDDMTGLGAQIEIDHE